MWIAYCCNEAGWYCRCSLCALIEAQQDIDRMSGLMTAMTQQIADLHARLRAYEPLPDAWAAPTPAQAPAQAAAQGTAQPERTPAGP